MSNLRDTIALAVPINEPRCGGPEGWLQLAEQDPGDMRWPGHIIDRDRLAGFIIEALAAASLDDLAASLPQVRELQEMLSGDLLMKRLAATEAERERYKEALEHIAEDCDHFGEGSLQRECCIARTALTPPEEPK